MLEDVKRSFRDRDYIETIDGAAMSKKSLSNVLTEVRIATEICEKIQSGRTSQVGIFLIVTLFYINSPPLTLRV